METQTTNAPIVPKKKRWNLFQSIADNPVIMKELRSRMRDRRTFILLTIYLVLISLFVIFIYFFMAESVGTSNFDPDFRQTLGKSIFGTVILIELLLVSFIGPGLTAGAITSERERQTFDLLKTTLLTPSALIFGKLGSSIIYLVLLIFATLPIQSLAFLLGGVGLSEIIIASILLLVSAIFFCTLGIFFSSIFKRTLAATVTSYGSILFSIFAIVLFIFGIAMMDSFFYNSNTASANIAMAVLWLVISTNPILTAIFTEVILIEEQTVFYASSSFLGYGTYGLLSPWIIYAATYMILTMILIFISIRLVKRPEH